MKREICKFVKSKGQMFTIRTTWEQKGTFSDAHRSSRKAAERRGLVVCSGCPAMMCLKGNGGGDARQTAILPHIEYH
jgi:hypothetical protein